MEECRMHIGKGFLCCPAYPENCFYVRLTDSDGNELVYWHYNEWQEDPKLVMGAIMGALCQLEDDIPFRF